MFKIFGMTAGFQQRKVAKIVSVKRAVSVGIRGLKVQHAHQNVDFCRRKHQPHHGEHKADQPIAIELLTGETLSTIEFGLQELATVQTLGSGAVAQQAFRRLN